MHEDAIPKGILWRLVRSFFICVGLMYALKLIGTELSFGYTAYGVGAIVVFLLTTLTDRTDFYNAGPRPQGPRSQSD